MKKLTKKPVVIISITVIVIIGLAVFFAMRSSGESYAEEIATVQDITKDYSFEGNIEAKDAQIIYATTTTTMKKIYVSEGDTVTKGDLLYELEGNNTESKLTQAKASVTSARVTYEDAASNLTRMTELYEAGATSLQSYEQAKNSYEIAAAQLTQSDANYDTAKNDAEDLRVYAEIDGEVSEIYVEDNDSMLSGTEIMDLINYDHLIVKLKIVEFDLDAIAEGKNATVLVSALNKEVGGMVSDISKQAEVINGVSYFDAEVALESNEDLKVGLSVEVKIIDEGATDAITISLNALQFTEEKEPYVLIRDSNEKVVAKSVSVGMNNGSIVEIKEGLKAGETVLFQPNANEFTPQGPLSQGRAIS